MTDTIHELIKNNPPEATALSAPGRADLTYGGLLDQAQAVVQTLNARGIGRGDRVAIVLPNGPEMASAFLCVGAGTATAPLNPAYRADEFDFYLTDLNAKALLVERGSQSPARAVAAEHGIPVMEIAWDESDPAGAFSLPEAD